jgi:hypothetical protein
MRRRMLEFPAIAGMVCIGGMEGVEEEVSLFLEAKRNLTVFVLARTGGAAALLSRSDLAIQDQGRAGSTRRRLRVVDEEVLRDLRPRLREGNGDFQDAPLGYVPYPLIMQVIVGEIAEARTT